MKTKLSALLITFCVLVSCQQQTPSDPTKIKKGMIKVAIFYPNGEGKTFNMDYYANKHMPMAARLFGDALKAMSIDKGLANGKPDRPLPYIAIGYFYFDTMTSFQNAMKLHAAKLREDVPNYTNIQPVVQVSEVQTVE
ncbi:EthD family reductase [Ascidiimonas sp. W6]|uniref:EthD family reductase n=1 Tax=Ascidiimonas meishanensis TaxID=3128903 RepID=UPI0030EE4BA6